MAQANGGIRGRRVDSGPAGEPDRGGGPARYLRATYFCVRGHRSVYSFAADVEAPDQWDCPRCSLPAGPDQDNPPTAVRNTPYRTHLAYLSERRTSADAAEIPGEALARVRAT
ncbi:RNA polymerase-binding protein RbpA [Catenulispora rubra]|uniref:RNA polymerase-binding protein RbpA n=1 Tax=Catenulispora rubra TaxID=280293 RepID=UPI001892133D|nr:RNA polymerase-binding protein RbpA [Catenulispora rubra]